MIRRIAVALLAFAGTAAAQPAANFTDITDSAGVAFTDELTESVCWGDYDNDGDPDVYLTHQTGTNSLLRNEGGGQFSDVSASVGVGRVGWGVGCAFGDLDNDGDLDLYVVQFGGVSLDILLRNEGRVGPDGGFVFSDISEQAGITVARSSRGVTLLDYDRDGLLDIFVNAIGLDLVYHNLGGLRFEEVAAEVGVVSPGLGVGAVATDVNNDGWIDVFTGNRSFAPNLLFINQGDGQFVPLPTSSGIDRVGLGMGVHSFDFDNDLDLDLYWTVWPGVANALYENLGDGSTYQDIASSSGTEDRPGWGISNNTGDIDNDGWEDFFVTNGFSDTTGPNILFRNNADATFSNLQNALPGGLDFDGRGAAFADVDNDGDVDLLVTADAGESSRLWRNDTPTSNGWITLALTGRESNRSGIGARIEVETDLRATVKEVSGGAGRGSQNDLPVEFGLGEASEVKRVTIFWPSGIVQDLRDVGMNQRIDVVEQRPPNCDAAVASPARLWPPDRRMVEVEIEGVTSDTEEAASIQIERILQDERTEGQGGFCPDARHRGGAKALLRAERSGRGNGRVYRIEFRAEDEFGGSCVGEVTVCAPRRGNRDCVEGALIYDSTACRQKRRRPLFW